MNIENTKHIIENIPSNVTLVAVTKNQSIDDIKTLVDLGVDNFAENKLQELVKKKLVFPDVKWHFIGRIQTNKIKDIVKHSVLIHSVSELRYLQKIDIEASKLNIIQDVLLQVNIANEDTKKGISSEEFDYIIKNQDTFKHVRIRGLMTIGDHVTDNEVIETTFKSAWQTFNQISKGNKYFNILSMGMSSDYKSAIACGSTMVRIGTLLFK